MVDSCKRKNRTGCRCDQCAHFDPDKHYCASIESDVEPWWTGCVRNIVRPVYNLIYTWGNNEKRITLKGRSCRILAEGKKNSIMIEFEDGQREIVSKFSIKEKEHMSEGRRSYRNPENTGDGGQGTGDQGTQQQAGGNGGGRSREYPPSGRGNNGGGNRGGGGYSGGRGGGNRGGGQQQDGKYVSITGLFPAKSGSSDIAFVKQEIADILHDIQEGDTIGVSMSEKTGRPVLWVIMKGVK